MFRLPYLCRVKTKLDRKPYYSYNISNRIETNLFRILVCTFIVILIYTGVIPSITVARQNESLQNQSSMGGVYLANRGQIARSRNFYENNPNWENIRGDLPIPFGDWGGITELTLDPFDPLNRAWISIGSSKTWVGSLWMTENLDDPIPDWNEILSQQQILTAIGGINLQVSRIQASTLQEGLIYIAVFRGDGSKGELFIGRSDDSGATWTWGGPVGNASDAVVGFEVSDHVVDRLWVGAGVNGKSKLFVSNNGGALSLELFEFDTFWHPFDIFVPKENNEDDAVMYVVVDGQAGWTRLMYSTNSGLSWKDITDPANEVGSTNDMVKNFVGDRTKLYYASTKANGPWSFMYSDDEGQSWEKRYTTGGWWSSVWQNPTTGDLLTAKAKLTLTEAVAFLSNDGGYTWIDKTGDWTSAIGRPYLGQPGTSGISGSITIVDALALAQPIIALGSDDAGISAINGSYSVSHNEIYFGEDANGTEIVSGFRFQNIPISRPDEILSAYIEFTVDGPYTNDIHIKFWGDISHSSQTFSDMSRPSNRPLTTQSAAVEWILSPSDAWNMGEKKNSPDLTPIIQEIIGRYGWQRGNAISIIVKNVSSNKNHRRVFAFEREGTAKAAKLIISRAKPIGITVMPSEINLGSHYSDSPFEALLTIKNKSYNAIATGSVSANATWISSIDPHVFSLSTDAETTIKISGKFPFHLGPFETVVKINLSLPEQREIKVRIYGNVINPNPPTNLISGSFVIAEWYIGDRRAFQRLLDEMQALNLTTIILHSIGNITNSGDVSLPVFVADLGWMIADASRRGMSVYIGMYSDDAPEKVENEFWKDPKKTLIINNSIQVVTEMERDYGSHSALKGYYVVQEAKVGSHLVDVINQFYSPFISQIHAAAPNKKVIAGGYMIQKEVSLNQLKDWVSKFKSNGLDIFLLQDGVGSFDNSLTTYPTMYNHFVAAREGASPIPLWAVVELFQWSLRGEAMKKERPDDNWLHPANTIRINQQIYFANAAGAAEKISWINQRHMSHTARDSYTAFGQETEHLYRGYKALYFTGTYYQNLSYSCSPPPSSQYPDRGGMLFDTIEGQLSLSEWIGFGQQPGSTVTITVDLGAIKPVSDVTAVVRSDTTSNIYYPTTMTVKVSTDGTNYNSLGAMINEYADTSGYSKAYLWVSAASSQLARYVKIEFIHGGYWLFLSELEVYHETENTVVSVKEESQSNPNEYLLMQNYPNPFNPITTIRYAIPKNSYVNLRVYNLIGQEIAILVSEKKSAGEYEVNWSPSNLPSGVYFYRFQADDFVKTKKLLLLK